MIKIAFFDTKDYDKALFDKYNKDYNYDITYFESKLNSCFIILINCVSLILLTIKLRIPSSLINSNLVLSFLIILHYHTFITLTKNAIQSIEPSAFSLVDYIYLSNYFQLFVLFFICTRIFFSWQKFST